VSILLGTGTGSFGAKTDFSTGFAPASVAVGDFNGDGNLDLAVADRGDFESGTDPETVSILLGTGTGSFGAKTDFGTGSPFEVAVGDFNGDGNLDLAVANNNNTVSILLGAGAGSFGAKTDFGTGIQPISVAVGDFNSDGKLDLAVANYGFNGATVSILLGTGTGSFGARTDFVTGSGPASVAVGDFNGDGKLDLVVANLRSNTVSILQNTGPIGFSLGFDSPTVTAQQGTTIRVTVNINRIGGFTGNVTVTPPDPLMRIKPKPPAPIATTDTSVTFKLKIKGGAPLGPHQETFTARDDSGHTIAVTLTVIVQ
ncbi:MAG: VCBS repeat-containing protein, partial [Acidobacteriota bacterium]